MIINLPPAPFFKIIRTGTSYSLGWSGLSQLVSRARPLFSVYVVVEKRVWSNRGQGGLVSYTPRFSRRANRSDHHFLWVPLWVIILVGLQLFVICSALAVDNCRRNTGRDGPKFIYNGMRKAASYELIKDKQVQAVSTFMKGNYIFVSLPGYWFGKSIICDPICENPTQ